MPIRTFIALEIPEESLEKIREIRNNTLGENPKVGWEKKEKLHLTLKFLGETNEKLVKTSISSIEKIVSNYKPVELQFENFGVFKKGIVPKILWLSIVQNMDLNKLAEELDLMFAANGFEKEKRRFKPHITILRFRGYEDTEKVLSLTKVILPEIKFTANKVIYFESKLLPSGSVYRPIKSFNLKN